MGLKNMVVVLKVSFLLLFLVGVTIARMDMTYHKGYDPSESTESGPCCDSCACTKSIPPQCHCADIRLNSCHSACEKCVCAYSYPAQCRCFDTTDFCYPPCKDSGDEDH